MLSLVSALQQRPWSTALLSASGLTGLIAFGFARLAPLPLLDAAVAFGDLKLGLALLLLFVLSWSALWLLFRVRQDTGRGIWRATRAKPAAHATRSYLR